MIFIKPVTDENALKTVFGCQGISLVENAAAVALMEEGELRQYCLYSAGEQPELLAYAADSSVLLDGLLRAALNRLVNAGETTLWLHKITDKAPLIALGFVRSEQEEHINIPLFFGRGCL